jgi:hypothetical protein
LQAVVSNYFVRASEMKIHFPEVVWKGPNEPPATVFATRDCYPLQSEEFRTSVDRKLDSIISRKKNQINCGSVFIYSFEKLKGYNLNAAHHKLGLVYCDTMMEHANEGQLNHVESPKRISAIFERHQEFDLIKRCHILQVELLMFYFLVPALTNFLFSPVKFKKKS